MLKGTNLCIFLCISRCFMHFFFQYKLVMGKLYILFVWKLNKKKTMCTLLLLTFEEIFITAHDMIIYFSNDILFTSNQLLLLMICVPLVPLKPKVVTFANNFLFVSKAIQTYGLCTRYSRSLTVRIEDFEREEQKNGPSFFFKYISY